MVTGKDMLLDRLFALIYEVALSGAGAIWTYADIMAALDCAKSPTLKQAVSFAVHSGVLSATEVYRKGRYCRAFVITDMAITAAREDGENENVAQEPF